MDKCDQTQQKGLKIWGTVILKRGPIYTLYHIIFEVVRKLLLWQNLNFKLIKKIHNLWGLELLHNSYKYNIEVVMPPTMVDVIKIVIFHLWPAYGIRKTEETKRETKETTFKSCSSMVCTLYVHT